MGKQELAAMIAEKHDLTKKAAAGIVDDIFDAVLDAAAKGEKVGINGFGTFQKIEKTATVRRNPRTGLEVNVPAKSTIKFGFSKAKQREMNS